MIPRGSVMGFSVALVVSALGAFLPTGASGFTLAHPYVETGSVDQWANKLADCAANVIVTPVDVLGEGKLGRPTDIAEGVAAGLIDMAILPANALRKEWPELSKLGNPGYVYDAQDMMALSESMTFLQSIDEIGDKPKPLSLIALGWRHATLVGTPMRMEDLRGLRLRPIDPQSAQLLANLGANPVPVPFQEAFAALDFGYIDGAVVDTEFVRNSISMLPLKVLNEATGLAPFSSPIVIVMNTANAAAMGHGIPNRIRSECLSVTVEFNHKAAENMSNLFERAKSAGMQVNSLSAQERAQWHDALESARAEWISKKDPVALAVLKALKK